MDLPDGAQVNQEEWDQFLDFVGKNHIRGAVRVLSKLPSTPRCKACGGPFGGFGGRLMKAIGRGPSRKNPYWCSACFEHSPEGGFVGTVGVVFADVRGSTALGESLPPDEVAALMSEFFDRATKVIVQHGFIDKLIGDEVMGVYIPSLARDGRIVDALVGDARKILQSVGYGSADGPLLDVGIGIDLGSAYLGHVGTETATDFTVIGDVVNTAARLQGQARPGQIVMREELALRAGLGDDEGDRVALTLKGKADTVPARILTTTTPAIS